MMIFALYFIWAYFTACFILSLILRRNDVADVAWGAGFVLVSIAVLLRSDMGIQVDRSLLVAALVCIWGVRLSSHIFARNIRKPEDARYAKWRSEWGSFFILRSYLQVFLLQGVLMYLIVTPVLLVHIYRGGAFGILDLLGLCVWIFGFYFESRGDRELRTFLRDPQNKGKILDTGLWRFTRHPNYFGEVMQWWGLGIIALSVPYGYVGIIGPLTISILILKVSGIPMLEKSMEKNPLFDTYRKTTSAFFPFPPKKSDIS